MISSFDCLARILELLSQVFLVVIGGTSIYIARQAATSTHKQAEAMEKHNMLSVKPIVTTCVHCTDEHIEIIIENNGVGPAIITNLDISVFGGIVGSDREAMKKALSSIETEARANLKLHDPTILRGPESLRAGDKLCLLKILATEYGKDHQSIKGISPELGDRIDALIQKHLVLHIKYESIYGEEFRFPSTEQAIQQTASKGQ